MPKKGRLYLYLAMVMGIVLLALLAPAVATHDPHQAILTDAVLPPGGQHLFGTDRMGRDLYSRVIYGTRTSVFATLGLVACIFVIGGTLGILSGYAGGKVDTIIMRISDMMVSFPGMTLAIAMAGIMGPGITNAVIAITMVSWTKYARLARSLALKVKHEDYILAARISGARTRHILWRYMLPSVLPTLVITAAADMGGMMLELAGFSFLGLGAQSASIEWGYMLNEGRTYMESAPWLMVFPGLAIFITVSLFNLLGDSIRDLLDPRDAYRPGLKKTAALVAAITTAIAVTGCGGGTTAAADNQTGSAHLTFGCYNFSDSLDPATNTNSSWCGIRYGITECLFKFNSEAVAVPNICDGYTVSDDYKVWTLHIRDGIRFSSGNEVTASAVKASIERLYRETDAEQGGTGNSLPQGYLIYDAIAADDAAGTVMITCASPTSNLPGILAYPYFAIIDAGVADMEIVGTGPYKAVNHNVGISIDLVRNDLYWNGEVPYDNITILFINDSSTKSMALQSGDVDLVENITTAGDLEKLAADDKYYISVAAGVRTGNSYINFDGVLGNDSLRKAILMALDSETMCSVTVAGLYTAGYSVLPSSLAYNYEQLSNPYPYNKQAAIDALDAAGIVDTDGDGWRELDGKNIELDYVAYNSRNLNDFAEAAALLLADIGIKSTVNIRDYDTALALQNAGEFDLMTTNTLTVGVGDPQEYLGNWYSGNSSNFGHYHSEAYDAVYEQLMVELAPARRTELITQLQQILIDDAATIVHGYYNSRMFSNAERVSGAEIATMDYYWLTTDIKPVR